MAKMNWSKCRYYGKPTLSIKDENEWLKQQDNRWRRARRYNQQTAQRSFDLRRPISATASSTAESPPW